MATCARASSLAFLVAPLLVVACTSSPGGSGADDAPVAARRTLEPAVPGATSRPDPPAYAFPVRSPRARFSRAHHDYPAADIFAPCGSPVVAPATGRVVEVSREDTWTPDRDDGATRGGLAVTVVDGDGTRYYGSHLSQLTPAATPGRSVSAGERLGAVGRTGSARGTPCHLHFGLSPACSPGDWWVRRGVVPPYPFLRAWQRGEQRSPAAAVTEWKATHGCPRAPAPASGST